MLSQYNHHHIHLFQVGSKGPLLPHYIWAVVTRYFIPVTIENRTCDISSATIGTLFSCVVCVSWTKIQGRYCSLCFVVFTQCDVCQSRNFQHKHNIRREKRKKNDKIDKSSKIERMFPPHPQGGHESWAKRIVHWVCRVQHHLPGVRQYNNVVIKWLEVLYFLLLIH